MDELDEIVFAAADNNPALFTTIRNESMQKVIFSLYRKRILSLNTYLANE